MKTKMGKNCIQDYSQAEAERFDAMHLALKKYNSALTEGLDPAMPNYGKEEMAAYSQYRELLIESEL